MAARAPPPVKFIGHVGPRPATVFLCVGGPASGKTTFARQLKKQTEHGHFCLIKQKRHEYFTEFIERVRNTLKIDNGTHHWVIDRANEYQTQRHALLTLARELDYHVRVVSFNIPSSVRWERLEVQVAKGVLTLKQATKVHKDFNEKFEKPNALDINNCHNCAYVEIKDASSFYVIITRIITHY